MTGRDATTDLCRSAAYHVAGLRRGRVPGTAASSQNGIPNLAADTRRRYLEVWGTHLLPRVGDYELRAFTPMLVEDLRDQMVASGVSAPTVRKR